MDIGDLFFEEGSGDCGATTGAGFSGAIYSSTYKSKSIMIYPHRKTYKLGWRARPTTHAKTEIKLCRPRKSVCIHS